MKSATPASPSSCQSIAGTSTMAPSSIRAGTGVVVAAHVGELAIDHRARLADLVELGHHRQHDAKLAAGAGVHEGAELDAQQPRPVEAKADGAPAHRRILFLRGAHVRQHLVAADIERAEGHRAIAGRGDDRGVEYLLLGRLRHGRGDHELQLGAEEADAFGAGLFEMRQIDEEAGVHQERDAGAVAGDRRLVAEKLVLLLPFGAETDLLSVSGFDIGRRAEDGPRRRCRRR